jgi:DNA polymerase III epsilon subunit-like protein
MANLFKQLWQVFCWMATKIKLFFQWIFKPVSVVKPPSIPISKSRIPGYHIFLFDTETTGLSNADRIVEFGIKELAITLENPELAQSFTTLINPGIRINNTSIHNISNQMVIDQPNMFEALKKIVQFVQFRAQGNVPILLAHNAIFDQRMLFNSLDANIKPLSDWLFGCTIEHLFKPQLRLPRNSLSYLAEHYQVTNPQPHRTMGDLLTLETLIAKTCSVESIVEHILPKARPLPTSKHLDAILFNALRAIPVNESYIPSNWEWAKIATHRPKNMSELKRLIQKNEFILSYGAVTLQMVQTHEAPTRLSPTRHRPTHVIGIS